MGNYISFMQESHPWGAPKFSVESDVPDLEGKVAIVTGSNTGVGKELVKVGYIPSISLSFSVIRKVHPGHHNHIYQFGADLYMAFQCSAWTKVLLQHNAKVYLAARNPDKAKAAIEDLRAQTGKDAIYLKIDLADLQSVKAAAEEFVRGVMLCPVEQVTADGYDLQFGTNALGPFYFTKLLLPTLIATAQATPEKHVRILNTSSVTHYMGTLDFATFKDGATRRKARSGTLYAQSKFADLVMSLELARRYGDQGIVSIAHNPGNLDTDLTRHMNPITRFFFRMILFPTKHGLINQLWGATSEEGADFNGKYLAPWTRIRSPKPEALDPVLGRQLWEYLEEQVENL
ncbi:hypothetical protein H0H93_003457 [Arthromyces matolae]|nr:hypothetical protein H0H93_003457 [Arthromyces matolae]